MPLNAHEHRHNLSIALIALPTVTLLYTSALLANEPDAGVTTSAKVQYVTMPKLGNTPAMDRYFSREVSDSFVYDQSSDNADAQALSSEEDTIKQDNAEQLDNDKKAVDEKAEQQLTPASDDLYKQSSSEPWNPITPEVYDPEQSVWEKIQQSDRLPLAQNDRVQFYEEQYLREALWISKILDRGAPFLSHLVATLDQRFMPLELALLPAIESGFKPTAKSTGHAAGLWQIVPITAREIGIQRGQWFDGRSDILVSTTAAIDYLSYLNAEFNGDWELTLAAYNAGPNRVRNAMKKNAEADLPLDYWSLDLPRETLNYVPKMVALIRLIKQPETSGFDMPYIPMEPAFESIDIGFRVSIDKAAKIADIDSELLHSLNAGLIHGVTAPEGPHQLLIPAGSGEQFQMAFADIDKRTAFAEPKTHDVVAGDTISDIAFKYGLSQRALLTMNGLDTAKIRIGQKLAVIDHRNITETNIEYVVSIGDTLSEIAYKFSVKVNNISTSDGDALDGDVIHPGDTLNINIVEAPAG